jgi:hypothetical protein
MTPPRAPKRGDAVEIEVGGGAWVPGTVSSVTETRVEGAVTHVKGDPRAADLPYAMVFARPIASYGRRWRFQ